MPDAAKVACFRLPLARFGTEPVMLSGHGNTVTSVRPSFANHPEAGGLCLTTSDQRGQPTPCVQHWKPDRPLVKENLC